MPTHDYPLADGTLAVGASTIANSYPDKNKQRRLMNWAVKLAKEGKDWDKEFKAAGVTGTLVHKLCTDFISGEEVAVPDDEVIVNCFDKFLRWWAKETKGTRRATCITEQPFVSEKFRFGGTPDIYIVNKNKLIDIKTSSGIWDSFWIQLAGYGILLKETNGYKIDEYQILWLPKYNRFDAPIRTDLRNEKQIFKHLLKVYQLRKKIDTSPPF